MAWVWVFQTFVVPQHGGIFLSFSRKTYLGFPLGGLPSRIPQPVLLQATAKEPPCLLREAARNTG